MPALVNCEVKTASIAVVEEFGPSETPSKQGDVIFALGCADLILVLTPSNLHFLLLSIDYLSVSISGSLTSKNERTSSFVSTATLVSGVFTTAWYPVKLSKA